MSTKSTAKRPAASLRGSVPAVRARPEQPASGFTLDTHMADDKTLVFSYNGRELVSKLGRRSVPGERVQKLPTKVIEFAGRQPLTSVLLPCRLGYHPRAHGQKIFRPNGDWAFTLLLCIDGVGHLELAEGRHRLIRGTVAVLRPFEFYAYAADERHPWSYYWIHFNGTQAQQYYDALTLGGSHTCAQLEPEADFVRSFEKILNLYQSGHAYKLLVQAAAALHQLLGDLYGHIASKGILQETPRVRIERTIEAVRGNLNMHESIHELAALANMSDGYYALQFRRHAGETPRSFFNKLRVHAACDYLLQTEAKIETISQLVGYTDSFYFCRLFKRITGKTPSEYRRTETTRPRASKGMGGTDSVGGKSRVDSRGRRRGEHKPGSGGSPKGVSVGRDVRDRRLPTGKPASL
jgi:AraC-like DNA-binding protein